ncbi:uncharacterized protein HD556DRAFT_1441127 [Suillus plorans]|uniref:ubiquitinyl hydrolase 1 n=1 Tax=Suillus plorans TaxID=116603 RepID=A0A9P7IXI4_9AGAM|nr:uncharacterized protein HD556DRAFT_1441127 [Suillus plorans]KAG1796950.1 hypothetical protein HD556DRAFT_1441127 [Suillus plorans]
MSVALESSETDVLEYIIIHIFCPIKLPQHNDHTPDRDRSLVDVVLGSARKFAASLPDDEHEQWRPLLRMLENLAVTMNYPALTEGVVESQIKSMQAGDILAYLIREQNAAVVLRRLDEKTIFESFEVSPRASAVMAAKGKLLCSYPGPAIDVSNSVVDNPTFPPELANFLSQMSYDALDSTSKDKGETAHPRYITQLLTDILRAFGKPADIPRIQKRIGDDVMNNNATGGSGSQSNITLPWRRSSLWLVIRVVLQTSLESTSLGRNGYKAFMASLMTDLVSKALEGDMPSDLLYFMSTKISRRLVKLQAEDGLLAIAMHKATEDIKDRLELRWKNVQEVQADSSHWDASSESDITRDTRLSLTKTEEYITAALHATNVQPTASDFQPPHRQRGTIHDFLGPDAELFESVCAKDPLLALFDFECAIEQGIGGWVDRVILDATDIDAACMIIQARAASYSASAQKRYSKNPENISIMLLTLFDLWVALDKLAVKSIPLLKEYSPEIPGVIFDSLLLKQAAAIERLGLLQQYVVARTHHARLGFSIFSDGADEDAFAVRYYHQSEKLKSCKQRIEDEADAERKKCIADFRDKSKKYLGLTNELNALKCDTYMDRRGQTQHKNNCCRCKKSMERENLSIEVHEWPLPECDNDAAVVLFELDAPIAFKMWRSLTFHFLHDICTTKSTQVAMQHMLLMNYEPFLCHQVGHPGQRITLGSETKSSLATRKSFPCTESDAIVKNELCFRLYDTTNRVWASGFHQTYIVSNLCTYALPEGPYHGLQCYLSGTQHTSNEVLANQAECHAELTLHEFIAFGSLRSGSLLQWINIIRELRARTLTFRDPAVHLLLLQASLEVGKLSANGSRVWHDELKVSNFGRTLINELRSLKVSVETNWLEGATMATISALVSRLLSSAEDHDVIQESHELLQAVRNTTFKWVQELSKALQEAPDEKSSCERQARVRDMAVICCSTYDVDPDNITALLDLPQDLEILVYCSITVKDNTPPDLDTLPPISRLLLDRNHRLSHFLETYFRCHVEDDQEGLDRAMKHLWSTHQRHTRWTVLESPNSGWLTCETAPSDDPSCQIIHLDMLTACLLVDGKPLARLPDHILQHPSYSLLFQHQVLDVLPSKIPGAEFATKTNINGFKISFGMRNGEVVIRSQHEKGHLLELIPPGKLRPDIPELLVKNHVHWLDLTTCAIEFRPVKAMWESSDKNWVLQYTEGGQSVARLGHSTLFDIHSPTFRMIAKTLSPIENSRYLIVTGNVDADQTVVKVDLPRLGLSFFIDKDGELHSHDQRGMLVDEDQSIGTMIGLVNKLVLRPKDQHTFSDRRVIIPQGNVVVKHEGHHVQVTIQPNPNHDRHHYHCYTIDMEFCRLTGNIGLTNKLYKAYLHAVCSAHVPDPLTKRTGVEEAMCLLQSAACYSFMKLDPFDCKLLARIGSLTVERTWHKSSQKVHWHHGLSSYVQSCAFYHAARNIVQYAQKLQVLSETPVTVCPTFPERDESLLERASQLSIVLYSCDLVNSFYPSESSTSDYTSRDVRPSIDNQMTFDCACMVRDWSITLKPCQALYNVFIRWNEISGKTHDVTLRYGREWLKPDLAKRWMTVVELCRDTDRGTHTFQLAFTLSAMTYSSPENMGLAATMFAFAVIPELCELGSPHYDIYDLSFGIKPLEQDLCRRIASCTSFCNSPEASLSRNHNESSREFDSRRQTHFQSKCLGEQKEAVAILLESWPCSSVPPRALKCLSSSRYDESTLRTVLKEQYTNCYRNRCLKTYLDCVQEVLDEVRRTFTPSIKQSYTFIPSNSDVISVKTAVLAKDLFQKPSPIITLLPDPLKQIQVLLSSRFSGDGLDSSPLKDVISNFKSSRSDQFGLQYAACLEDSRIHLENEQLPIAPCSTRWTVDMLQHHHAWCNKLYMNAFRRLEEHLAPSGLAEESLSNSGQWPRITVTFLLGLLASTSKTSLCDSWKASLTNFAHILLRLQRSQRLLKLRLAADVDNEEFLKELVNDGHLGLDGTQEYVDWLLIQAENRFLIRPTQAMVAMEMISPHSGKNTALQLHMGEGKSSVIVPICCAALADGKNVVRVVVLKPLAVQMFQLLVERLSGLTNRRIFHLPFSRSLRITSSDIQSLFEECKRVRGIIVALPDHILSFKMMAVEQQLPRANAIRQPLVMPLLDTQRWLDKYTRDILDESDELLHVRFQLVYTMGDQQHLEGYPDRWTTTQQVMTLVAKHACLLQQEFPLGVEFQEGAIGTFPHFRVLDVDAGKRLVKLVSDDILAGNLPNFVFEHVPSHIQDSIREYLTQFTIEPQLLHEVRSYCTGSSMWNGLLLIRGLLAHGVLIYTMKERRWRVDYGLDPQRTKLAVPYRAKDVPSSRADFGHPDIAVTLTCLSYYYGGLTEEQVALCFRQLLKQDNPVLEYETWIEGLSLDSLPENLRHLSGINMESTEQFTTCLVPLFGRNKAVVDFFLSRITFPQEAKEFPKKLSCSAWDLAERKSSGLPTTGFSGTNDFRYLLPTNITQHDLAHQRGTNAKVLNYLLQEENDFFDSLAAGRGAEELLNAITKESPEIRVLLDVGAQVLDLENDEVAMMWLDINKNAQAAIYFDKHDELVVHTRDHVIESFCASSFAQKLDQCVLYLDDEHTRGTDVKLPRGFRAAVTLGPKVTKDRLVQGCMRMRKLGHGHSVMFFAPPEIDRSIRAVNNNLDERTHVSDILVWAMTETCLDIEHRASQWFQHGVDFKSRHNAWSSFLSGDITPTELTHSWLQPEAKHLEKLYAPALTGTITSQTSLDEELLEICSGLGLSISPDNRTDEEQEREVIQEIEREPEVERPPKVPAATHHINEDVRYFIQTGCIPNGSRAFTAVFDTLTTTSAAFSGCQPWSRDVFASSDFATTVQAADKTDSYIRPVNWILSSNTAPVLVIVSPFEVNGLLFEIRASKQVHLHAYTPRIIKMMKSCDDLRLYVTPSLPARWKPHDTLIQQLNVFAGQLYFPRHRAYVKLCRFLGIYTADLKDQGTFEIQSDGFIKPEHRPPAANLPNNFQQSPIPMLKAIFGIRRKGMGYLPTHLGKLLVPRQLTTKDFDDRQVGTFLYANIH